jgi:hypothetical protein
MISSGIRFTELTTKHRTCEPGVLVDILHKTLKYTIEYYLRTNEP